MQRKISVLLATSLLATTFLAFGSVPAGAADAGKVDIKVETNYDGSTKADQVWEANNVTPGDGRELLGSATPTVDQGFDGSVDVDIELGVDNTQISLFTRESDCLDLVRVTLTGDIFGTLAMFRDGLFMGTPAVLAIDNTTPGTVILTWTSSGCDSTLGTGEFGESVFNLTSALPPTGSNAGPVALIAMLTLLAGGALVLTTRRRTHHS